VLANGDGRQTEGKRGVAEALGARRRDQLERRGQEAACVRRGDVRAHRTLRQDTRRRLRVVLTELRMRRRVRAALDRRAMKREAEAA
jgi:hypothetical protein